MTEQELKDVEQMLEEHCLNEGNYDVCKRDCNYFKECEEWQAEQLKRN